MCVICKQGRPEGRHTAASHSVPRSQAPAPAAPASALPTLAPALDSSSAQHNAVALATTPAAVSTAVAAPVLPLVFPTEVSAAGMSAVAARRAATLRVGKRAFVAALPQFMMGHMQHR